MALLEHNGIDCMDVADVVALEQKIAAKGTSLAELMDRAGSALAEAVFQCAEEGKVQNVLIFAGSGNNGGDGWVAARILGAADNMHVSLVTPIPASEIAAEPARGAAAVCESLIQAGETQVEVLVNPAEDTLRAKLGEANIVVDAMLGTGFKHNDVREPMRTWIELISAERSHSGTTVIAADCPSGLNAQTGSAASTTVKADITVTMLSAKTGMLMNAAAPYVGKLLLAPLVSKR